MSNACPLKQSQKSLHPQLAPFSLEFLKWVFQLVDFVLLIAKTTKSPYFGYWSRISAHKGFCPQELEALEKTFRSFMTNSLTFLSVRLKDVAIFGRCVFFLWSLSAFFVIFSNASRALPPSSVDVSHIFSIFLWRKKDAYILHESGILKTVKDLSYWQILAKSKWIVSLLTGNRGCVCLL